MMNEKFGVFLNNDKQIEYTYRQIMYEDEKTTKRTYRQTESRYVQRSILSLTHSFFRENSLGRGWVRETRLIDNVEEVIVVLNEMQENATEMLA